MMKALLRLLLPFAGPIFILLAWQSLAVLGGSPFFPPLQQILEAFQKNWLFARVGTDVIPSLTRFVYGYGSGIALGIGLGMLLGFLPTLRRALDPVIDFVRAIPPLALIPIYLLIFGIGDTPKIIIIAWGALFNILLNTVDGFRSMEPVMADMARVYRLSLKDQFMMRLHWATPQIVAGARVALAISFILMVTSEMFASTEGIGFFVIQAQRTFAIPDMWSGILLLGILGYVFSLVFALVESRVTRWYRGYRSANDDRS